MFCSPGRDQDKSDEINRQDEFFAFSLTKEEAMSAIEVAVFLAQVTSSEPQSLPKRTPAYENCVKEQVGFYASFCYPLADIAMATRSGCRPLAAESIGMGKDSALDNKAKADLIRKYIETMDELIYAQAMETRLVRKIDCGQFNNYVTRDTIDLLKKDRDR